MEGATMSDYGRHAFDLARKLESDGWTDAEAVALSYARGGVVKVVADWWEDGCKEYQHLCNEVISWHQDLEHAERLADPTSDESWWAKHDAEKDKANA